MSNSRSRYGDARTRWLSDSRRLLYGLGAGIRLVDTTTGIHREIFSLSDAPQHLDISEDDRWIYFVLSEEEEDIWLLTFDEESR